MPPAAVVPAALAIGFLALPLVGLAARAPWDDLGRVLGEPAVRQALGLSLWTATVSTLVCVLFGVPLAWLLARGRLPARRLVRAVVTLPLVLPPVVGGVALLTVLGRRGLVGGWLDAVGITLPFTPAAVVVAQTFVAMPFLVVTVEGALRASDRRFEEAAASLGASRLTVLRRVTLPLVAPSVAAGAVLTWARALGEFGATVTFAGSFPGRTQTLPLTVYAALDRDPDAAVALSLLLLAVCVAVLVGLRGRWVGEAGPERPTPRAGVASGADGSA
ncbi:ABC transporter permease [Actinotalea sp. JY-7885]|uniref:ABC transporter permease n=1 Tax=Actinotalea sp. JY-7885 TaxID=2758576 RepID=UPI00165E4BDF|nr:ABC transporter permease [Actinotalea sp. JY-7885]